MCVYRYIYVIQKQIDVYNTGQLPMSAMKNFSVWLLLCFQAGLGWEEQLSVSQIPNVCVMGYFTGFHSK